MTELREKPQSADPEQALATLAAYWADPFPGFMGRLPKRIAGGAYDQAVPEGTSNPYWEIVRQMPCEVIEAHYYPERQPEPDAYFFTPGSAGRRLVDRGSLCGTFAWAIPSPGDIAWITSRLDGRSIVEPGAGLGYWAWQLTQAGADVAAYEPASHDDNTFVAREPWYPVLRDDHGATGRHPDRAMLLCWPSYSEPWAAWSLAAYKGDQLFYIGEDWGGCCADDDFFSLLGAEWDTAGECEHHVSYHGIHSRLTEYRRRSS